MGSSSYSGLSGSGTGRSTYEVTGGAGTGFSAYSAGGGVVPSAQKIIAAGNSNVAGHPVFAVVRYNADGSRDTSFGTGGLVLTSFGAGTDSSALTLTTQADGKYVAGGSSGATFALVRYNVDGSLDTGFGTGGLVTTPVSTSDACWAVLAQGDGKIVAVGQAGVLFGLVRYHADGSLDTSFGTGGKVTTQFPGSTNDGAFAAFLQADGKIVAVGSGGNTPSVFELARYDTDGTLDATYGTGGLVTTPIGASDASVFGAAIQPDGKVIAGGSSLGGEGRVDSTLARYNTDGSPDTSFGTGGVVVTNLTGGAELLGADFIYGVAVQPSGKIVVAAFSVNVSVDSLYVVARYNVDGSLDSTFGTGGITVTDVGPSNSQPWDAASQSDGMVVVVGSTNGGQDFGLARYTSAGVLDSTFGTSGLVDDDLGGAGGEAIAVVLVG